MLRRVHPHAIGLVVVLLVAVGMRLAYWHQIRATPFFLSPVIDADFYNELAQALARGEGTGRAPFMMPPLFPLVLSVVYRAAGVDLVLAHGLQFLFGTLTALLTTLLALRIAGLAVAMLAGLLVATNPALLFVEGDLLATPLAVLLDLAFIATMVRLQRTGGRVEVGLGGVLLGLAALARPAALVVLPGFVVWLAWRRRRPLAALLLVACTLGTLLPVSLHNKRANGEWVWISANGGINFWIGNNADWRRTVALRPGPEWRVMNDLPLREAGRITPVERDRWFWHATLEEMRAAPLEALGRFAEKALLLVHDQEIMRDFDFYYFRQHFAPLLWTPTGSFAFLLTLALVGSLLVRPRPPGLGLLWLFAVPYALSIVAFFVTARYRAPLLPVLAIAAAIGIVHVVRAVRTRQVRFLSAAVLLAAAVLLVSLPDWLGVDGVDEVEARYRIAKAHENAGDLQLAFAGYEDVLRRDPDHALAAARAAGCEQRLGQVQDAVRRYEELLTRHPDYVEVMINLANLAWRFGDAETAQHYFVLAEDTDPWYAQAFGYHGMFLASQGQPQEASNAFSSALRLDPGWEQLRVEQARVLMQLRRPEEALGVLAEIPAAMLRRDAGAHEVRGDVLLQLGREAEARQEWMRSLQIEPRNPRLQQKLQGKP